MVALENWYTKYVLGWGGRGGPPSLLLVQTIVLRDLLLVVGMLGAHQPVPVSEVEGEVAVGAQVVQVCETEHPGSGPSATALGGIRASAGSAQPM